MKNKNIQWVILLTFSKKYKYKTCDTAIAITKWIHLELLRGWVHRVLNPIRSWFNYKENLLTLNKL